MASQPCKRCQTRVTRHEPISVAPQRFRDPRAACPCGRVSAKVQIISLLDATLAEGALPADAVIVARLRNRDEAMFTAMIDAWSPGMPRAARSYVADEHTAQDVVQEAWLGVTRHRRLPG